MRLTPRRTLLGAVALALSLAVPQAGAALGFLSDPLSLGGVSDPLPIGGLSDPLPLGGLSDPVGLAGSSQAQSYLCSVSSHSGTYAYICANRVASSTASSVQAGYHHSLVAHVYVGVTQCNPFTCQGWYREGEVPAADVNVDPTLDTATVDTTLHGCRIRAVFTQNGLPAEGSDLYRWIAPDKQVMVSVHGEEGVSRPALGKGSLCGVGFSQAPSYMGHFINGGLDGYITNPT